MHPVRYTENGLDYEFVAELGRHVAMRPDTTDHQVFKDVFVGRYHIPPEMPTPKTVLDLGANIGLTAAHYKSMWPEAEIVAIEMDSSCAKLAELNTPGVQVWNYAVAGYNGYGSYNPDGGAWAYKFQPDNVGANKILALSMKSIIRDNFVSEPVDFVKMDVESSEHAILRDSTWAYLVKHILIELHPGGPDNLPNDSEILINDASAHLRALGFETRPHVSHPRAVFGWKK